MKPFNLPRVSPTLRSALHRTFTAASRTRPKHPLPFSPSQSLTPPSSRRPLSTLPTRSPRRIPLGAARRPYTTQQNTKPATTTTTTTGGGSPPLTFSQRLRKLSREYGWSVFGIYMLLTALDFPFCFAAVRYLGADRVGHYEHVVVEAVAGVIPDAVKEAWRGLRVAVSSAAAASSSSSSSDGGGEAGVEVAAVGYDDHGVKEAEKRNKNGNASIWTQLALAYAIHKSFIFIRVPLTVALTPKVVKVLRGWGWDIGKRRPKGVE